MLLLQFKGQFNHMLTVLPPLPMTLPAALEGTFMCVSSLTSSFAEKKFSSFSFPNIRPWAWNTEEGMRQGETGENGDKQWSIAVMKTIYEVNPPSKNYLTQRFMRICSLYLKLSFWCSSNDDHPLSNIWTLSRSDLTRTERCKSDF